jgi:dipeptidyl aminopeptidase/acylaminoacyl peptidase
MKLGLISFLVSLGLAISPVCAQEAPLPVEAFGRLPGVSAAAISPDGSKVALAIAPDHRTFLRIIDIDRAAVLSTAEVGENNSLDQVGWADDSTATFLLRQTFQPHQVLPSYISFGGGAARRIDLRRNGVFDLESGRVRLFSTNELTPWADQAALLVAPIEGDPGYGRMIGQAPQVGSRNSSVYRVNLRNGVSSVMSPRGVNNDTDMYLLDSAGAVVARRDVHDASNRWRIYVYDDRTPRLLMEGVSDTGGAPAMSGLLADGRIAILDEDENNEYNVLYAVDRSSGAREIVFRRQGFDLWRTIRDPWTHGIVGVEWYEEERHQHYFDADLEAMRQRVEAAFPTGAALMTSWSRDRRRALAYGERGLDGGAYYLYDAAAQSLQPLALLYPEIGARPLGERQAISFSARDGVRIPAYLTLPPNRSARGAPLVVLVHGGPASRDTMDFDWWAAFLASRGYAVLQPNFRGSAGYGASWERAGWRQWGGLMQTDVEDGVAALARAGTIDPARVCIVGASYGGYAALAGAALSPETYRCAAGVAGVYDLPDFLRHRELLYGEESQTADYWRVSIGDREEDRERIRSVSPVNLADRVRSPVLLLHGTDDTVVPIEQTRRMQRALERAGKDVRFVELSGDDHGLSDRATRIQMLREIETFLAQHIGAGAAAN